MHDGHRLLSDVLAEMAAMSAEPFDVSELVHLASDRACEVLACDGALVLLSVDGTSLAAAGMSPGLSGVEAIIDLPMTPCHEALSTRAVVVHTVDDDGDRYPAFTALARRRGMRAVLSVPMKHKDRVIGTLCLVRTQRRHFLSHTIEDAQKLADVIAANVVREEMHRAALQVSEQLQHALESRVVIEQAKGMVAAELGVTVDDALAVLRQFARSNQLKLAVVAADVVDRTLPTTLLRS